AGDPGRGAGGPCLAAAAGSGESQEARSGVGEHPADRRKLVLAAEERRRRDGQIRLVERLQRWVVAGAELEDPLRRGEVLEAVLAEVPHPVADQFVSRLADEHLAAVTGSPDPRRAVDGDADVALLGDERRARLQSDPPLARA